MLDDDPETRRTRLKPYLIDAAGTNRKDDDYGQIRAAFCHEFPDDPLCIPYEPPSGSGVEHFLLDLCGIVLDYCDAANAGLYLNEGDYVNAAISGAATPPVLGVFATIGKWIGKAGKACSFTGDTHVLMADGSTKPIKDVEVGDQVQATDPETGKSGARTVTAVWHHLDTVLDLVTEDGATVTTTEDHPYWNATDHQWQQAQHLDPGDHLLTADGTTVRVGGLRLATTRSEATYNLTVSDIHTYYVVADEELLLVHNSCPPILDSTFQFPGAGRGGKNVKNFVGPPEFDRAGCERQ
ncbi:polymorphic toxin-type HINT domain-containing protein [Actinophytocola gossypii]|uniref:Hint domain-containing protein n=1 Tax=Actinophytocola gossypii TaxID=2812003 RepID=A0ABT2J9U5_9PSEU|nr:polymorphic toxin-type HINT domain-containing protein [Actinophytocola gossypii]MCT2584638.1 hypothetical protein [Actinophytocola gossypii]